MREEVGEGRVSEQRSLGVKREEAGGGLYG